MAILKGPVNPVVTGITTFPELDTIQVTSPNRHRVSPALVLDFANSKTLDPRITFTRGSNALYYDGTTALAEHNIVKYSQEFDNAFWTKTGATVTANSIAAPDGTTTADTLTENSSNSEHEIHCGITPGISTVGTYTLSVYAKAGTRSWITLYCAGSWQAFNLSAGTVGTASSLQPATITSVGNGWYRCTVSGLHSTGTQYFQVNIATGDSTNRLYSDGTVTYTGNGTGNVYIWGAQVEYRPSATGYTLTTAEYVNNFIPVLKTAGPNQPRFDEDPITFESKGLLLEPTRTNLLLYSDQFDNAAWAKYGSTVTGSAIVAPDGSLGGEKVVETTANDIHRVAQGSISVTSGTQYTFSCYAKAGERTFIEMRFYDSANNVGIATYDLINGTVSGITGVSASMIPVGNGWYRCVLTSTSGATSASGFFLVYMKINASLDTWTGNGYSGLYLWGAQVEVSANFANYQSFPTSYISTGAATATRGGDDARMIGSNFSNWYNQTAGSFYCEAKLYGGGRYWHVTPIGFSAQDQWEAVQNVSQVELFVYKNSQIQSQMTSNLAHNITRKVAGSYAVNDVTLCIDGGTVSTDTSAAVIIPTGLILGGYANSGILGSGGNIKKIAYYPVRLTNAELQGLTTA